MTNESTIEVRDLREQDWLWTSTAILFHPDINGNTYKVYCGLSTYANNHTQKAFPSISTLSRRLHMSRSTVIRGLLSLEENGAIQTERKTGEHNIYFLLKVIMEGKKKAPKIAEEKEAENWVKTTLEWAEKRRGSKFVIYGKQIGALGLMKKAGYTPKEICLCYIGMEKSEYWKGRGFDFTDIAVELPKKISNIREKTNGISEEFAHLTKR